MSIIRQRSKNLIVSGLIGFICGLIVVLLIYLIGIKGNIQVIEWILNDSQLEVMTMSEPVPEEVVQTDKVIMLKGTIKKDTIISEGMLAITEVVSMNIPQNYSQKMEDLLGKKALIDIDASTILTTSMVEQLDVFQVSFETLEIQNVHYPDILSIGQPINMRIHYPTGQDYTVVENKTIVHIDQENKSFFINLTEEEILSYSSAKEDKNIYPGTELYITIEGQGRVSTEGESQVVKDAYKNGLIYSIYPLNPNVLALSQVKNYNAQLLEDRVALDLSLKAFFDLNSERFSYDVEIKTNEDLSGDTEDVGDDTSGDLGLDSDDESLPLQSASSELGLESLTLNEPVVSEYGKTNDTMNNENADVNTASNDHITEDDTSHEEANEIEADFDF